MLVNYSVPLSVKCRRIVAVAVVLLCVACAESDGDEDAALGVGSGESPAACDLLTDAEVSGVIGGDVQVDISEPDFCEWSDVRMNTLDFGLILTTATDEQIASRGDYETADAQYRVSLALADYASELSASELGSPAYWDSSEERLYVLLDGLLLTVKPRVVGSADTELRDAAVALAATATRNL